MDERDALLATIFANNVDDVPRLVYADWLDEHGEPAQAGFIRAQCAYALTEPQSDDNIEHWHDVLAWWERLKHEWRYELAGLWKVDATWFRRGFLDRMLTLGADQFVEMAADWWPRMPVRKVLLELSPWTVVELAGCEELSRLSELALRGQDPHGSVIPVLAECPYLSGLRVLDLTEFQLGIEAIEALTRSRVLGNLTHLRLPYFMRPNREGGRLLKRRFGDACEF